MARLKSLVGDNPPKKETKAPEKSMETVVPSYWRHKQDEKELKKELNSEKAFINKYFDESDEVEFTFGGATAKRSESVSYGFDEDSLLPFLKKHMKKNGKVEGLVRRKEYVDMDVLEDAVYNGIIPAEVLAPYQTSKTTVKLLIKKADKKD